MQHACRSLLLIPILSASLHAQTPAITPTTLPTTKPVLKIIPGKVIVPTDAMRRPFGELVSFDFKNRTGTFRNENTDEIMPFIILPYSEIYRHAAFGDMQDFRIGERLIFRLHQNDEGKWIWLTYFQDEMSIWTSHKEYYYVDRLDPAKSVIEYTQKNMEAKPPFIRAKGLILETDADTRYWKNGEPATFADIAIGDKLCANTHGLGKGKHHPASEIFLDDVSMLKVQNAQKAVHTKRLADEGWPGYVDTVSSELVSLTLFQEGRELVKDLKAGAVVRIAGCGPDRKGGEPVEGTIKEAHAVRNLNAVTITLKGTPKEPLMVGGVARVWVTSTDAARK